MSSPRETKVEEELTLLDWLGAAVASLGTMFCCLFAVFIGPRFQKLFADFGGEIPPLTRLAFIPWVPLLLGLIPALMATLALVGKTPLSVRRGLIIGASFLALSTSGLCVYAVYLPISAARALLKQIGDGSSQPEPYMKSLTAGGVIRALPFVLALGALLHSANGLLAW